MDEDTQARLATYLSGKYVDEGLGRPPFLGPIGQMYEQTHLALRTVTFVDDAERDVLRTTAVALAVQLYGTERASEPWENRFERMGEEDTIWPEAASMIDSILERAGVVDVDQRDVFITELCGRLRIVFEPHEDALSCLLDLNTITETSNNDALVHKVETLVHRELDAHMESDADIVNTLAALEARINPPQREVTVDSTLSALEALVQRTVPEKDSTVQNTVQTMLTAEQELRTLFTEIVSPSPDAGQ